MSNPNQIIIIEDDFKYQSALTFLIEDEDGFSCLNSFESTESFFRYVQSHTLHIDIILLDIELQGKKGTEAIPEIKKTFPETKIIMITQFDNDEHIFNAMSAGANGYLLKSSGMENIMNSIKDVNRGISPMNPYIASRVLDMFKNIASPKKDYHLTNQEKNILQEVVKGLSKRKIAEKLFISFHTVDTHFRNIYQKLNVNNNVSLVVKTVREQII